VGPLEGIIGSPGKDSYEDYSLYEKEKGAKQGDVVYEVEKS